MGSTALLLRADRAELFITASPNISRLAVTVTINAIKNCRRDILFR
ncbi:MAG: hypothetical protein IJC18_02820 [Clostridia bacterium]|nr:hypothetical protein [Clostridia bacterium]